MRGATIALASAVAVLAIVVGTRIARTAADRSHPNAGQAKDASLVVHEWGTFTGFAGSDGVQLPFSVQIGLDLPPFVFTRTTQAARQPSPAQAAPFAFSKGDLVALERMETPVVYFYTPTLREVSARVDFPAGLLTEFYPAVRKMTPEYNFMVPPKVGASSLDWGRVRLVPAADRSPGPGNIPPADGSPYAHARETDSAVAQFSDRPGEVQEEKFLFYRGVGDFLMPLAVKGLGGDQFSLKPAGPAPIGAAFIVRVRDGRASFARYTGLQGLHASDLAIPGEPGSLDDLAGSMTQALIAEGLYEKEAHAMVKTWQSSWFGEEGTRLLYTVPRVVTDKLLPLTIVPTPKEMTRVMVGRLELLTPEQEGKLQQMLIHFIPGAKLSPEEAREIRILGRFQRVALDRAVGQIGGSAGSQASMQLKANEIQWAAVEGQ